MKTIMFIAAMAVLTATPARAEAPPPISELGPGLVGRYYPPPRPGGPVVLVLGGSEGGLGGSWPTARALADQGLGALALAYFGVGDLPPVLEDVPLETFQRGVDWLSERPEVAGRRIGVLGVSKGAEAALLAASRDRRICAVVAGVPSNVAWEGINSRDQASTKGSWTVRGRPLAYVPYDMSGPFTTLLELYERSLVKAKPRAMIPVERIAGPVLLVSGREDGLWPSTRMADAVIARLDAKPFAHAHTHLAYASAGHAAFGPPLPAGSPNLKRLGALGGTPEGNQAARADSWPKATAFLRTALAGKGCDPLPRSGRPSSGARGGGSRSGSSPGSGRGSAR